MAFKQMLKLLLPICFLFFLFPCLSVDFLFNSFNVTNPPVYLMNDAFIDSSVIQLTNASNQSYGRAVYPTRITMKQSSNSSSISSFSTSFVFSVLPDISTSPSFGLAFFLCNTTSPPGALASQFFGLFTSAGVRSVYPLLAVEFDTGENDEFNDPDANHIGIDLNSVNSTATRTAGYYNSTGGFIPVIMRTGQNVHAWIDFDGASFQINVSVAPIGIPRPSRPTLSFTDPDMANYISSEMYVGFSASTASWVEAKRILAWSFSDTGVSKDLDTTMLPVFRLSSSSNPLSTGSVAGIIVGCTVCVLICVSVAYLVWRNKALKKEEEEIEDWELEYWPHRFSFDEVSQGTDKFSQSQLLGAGGFGRVYKGTLSNNTEVAVKCISHDSKQGLREFMAEIASMGRLQHRNLVPMRGWCRKGNELMLVYDYMPNSSLNRWIFDKPKSLLPWQQRRQILADVAEGLNYLHHGWDQVVIHRDVKSYNVLLDHEMRGRLGDFGLAKLHQHGEVPNTTRVVGTLGYLAPELATVAIPTSACDVYSFGIVVLEMVCGRRPVDVTVVDHDEEVLIDWVRDLYVKGMIVKAADKKLQGEFVVEEMEMVLKLGLACCHPDPLKRPTMKEVVAVLVGDAVAATPADLLSELARNGSNGGSGIGVSEVPLSYSDNLPV